MFQRRTNWADPDGIIAQIASKKSAELKEFVFTNRSKHIKLLIKRILQDVIPNISKEKLSPQSDNMRLTQERVLNELDKMFSRVVLNDLAGNLSYYLLEKKHKATKQVLHDLKQELASYRSVDEAVNELVVSSHP